MDNGKTLNIGSSPHIRSGNTVAAIMRQVLYALLPIACFAVYQFGISALLVLITAVFSCLITEYLLCRATAKALSLNNSSALVTGLIYGLTLPPDLPLWMVFVGGAFAIALGKFIFGGLGCNVFNPALVGRAFLQAAFPSAMTHWMLPLADDRFTSVASATLSWPLLSPDYDTLSQATPLALMKFANTGSETTSLLLGSTSGSTGETSALLILLCGSYLIARQIINWRIPLAIFLSVALLSTLCHNLNPQLADAPFMLLSGGLMFGALFMATDPVASPVTPGGAYAYGALIGVLVVIIRYWSGLPEGVMYAILLANAVSPHLDHWLQPRVFGSR